MVRIVVFVLVAALIAMIRLRCSPWYPPFNDVNSDVYAFQLIGNSWLHGYLPYRDVYDVKGPFFYLLFGMFAWLQPWSMGPPLVFLVVLAFCSLCLAYAIARMHLERRRLAALASIASCLVIYLGVAGIPTSIPCEELAVPGVLLLLWLVLRWLRDRDSVPAGWLLIDGVVLGALFWTKYLIIAPWAAMGVALLVLVVRRRVAVRDLGRVVGWHLVGVAIATAITLAFYAPVLSNMVDAYFLGKRGAIKLATELPNQFAWAREMLIENTGAALVLLGVLAVLSVWTVHGRSPEATVLLIAFCLSVWASLAFVRHEYNLFMPLSFCAVAIAKVMAVASSRGRTGTRAAAAGLVVVTVGVCALPLALAVARYGLLERNKQVTCYDLTTRARSTHPGGSATVFATTAGGRPILSVGTMFAARTSYISRQPVRHPSQFVDHSWAHTAGADDVQTRHLQERTFDYVWINIPGMDKLGDIRAQIAGTTYAESRIQPQQAAALIRNYVPVLSCNNNILLRAR